MKYRAEIDGLRALAVLPVILFHAGFESFSGGFIGVDIFFVISGYLITTIIFSELEKDEFSILNFYERRARRILPALFFTILITILVAPFVLIPDQIKDLGQALVSIAAFTSNYFFYLELDYFNEFSSKNPLLHTWSLAVEEQFYVFFPLILLVIFRKGSKVILLSLGAILVFSFAFAIQTTSSNPSLSFYSLHTRAWELMFGSFASILLLNKKSLIDGYFENKTYFLNLLSIGSAVTLLVTFFAFDYKTPHPSWSTLIPVIASFLLIVIMGRGDIVTKLLSNPVIVYIGLISYSLYLIHNPIFSYIDIYFDYLSDHSRFIYKLLSLPFVLGISLFCYKFVETPFRNKQKFNRKYIFSGSIVLLSSALLLGIFTHLNDGFMRQINNFYTNKGIISLVNQSEEKVKINLVKKQYLETTKKVGENYAESTNGNTCQNISQCKKILVIGDSFAEDVFLSLAYSELDNEVTLLRFDDECMNQINDISQPNILLCDRYTKDDFLKKINWASNIIISAKWQEQTYKDGFDLAMFMSENSSANIDIVGSILFSNMQTIHLKLDGDISQDRSKANNVFYRYARWDRVAISDKLRNLVNSTDRLNWIEKSDFFCSFEKEECYLLSENGQSRIWDNAHLTVTSYKDYSNFILGHL